MPCARDRPGAVGGILRVKSLQASRETYRGKLQRPERAVNVPGQIAAPRTSQSEEGSIDFVGADTQLFIAGGASRAQLRSSTDPRRAVDLTLDERAAITASAASPDGSWIAFGDAIGQIVVWTIDPPMRPVSIVGARGPVRGLALSRDGSRLAVTAGDCVVRVWSLRDAPLPIEPADGNEEPLGCRWDGLAFDESGERLFASSFESVRGWDVMSRLVLFDFEVFGVDRHDERFRLIDGDRGTLLSWDKLVLGMTLETQTTAFPSEWVLEFKFVRDGPTLATVRLGVPPIPR